MGLLSLNTGPFHRFGSRYSTLFDGDHFLGRNAFEENWLVQTPTNLQENGKELLVEVALPGFEKEHIDLRINNSELHISASKDNNSSAYQIEEIPKKVDKYFQLSPSMDQENIKAKLRNGVLRLSMPYAKGVKRQKRKVRID